MTLGNMEVLYIDDLQITDTLTECALRRAAAGRVKLREILPTKIARELVLSTFSLSGPHS